MTSKWNRKRKKIIFLSIVVKAKQLWIQNNDYKIIAILFSFIHFNLAVTPAIFYIFFFHFNYFIDCHLLFLITLYNENKREIQLYVLICLILSQLFCSNQLKRDSVDLISVLSRFGWQRTQRKLRKEQKKKKCIAIM